MTDLSGWVTDFYEDVPHSDRGRAVPGRLFDAPVLYKIEELQALRILYAESRTDWEVRLRNPEINGTLFDHQPVHELNLRANEELVVAKCKRRPVVLLGSASNTYGVESWVCAPIYGHGGGVPQNFAERAERFEIDGVFHLPRHEERNWGPSLVHFDQVQAIAWDLLKPRSLSLTGDFFWLLTQWLVRYLTGTIDDDAAEIIRSVRGETS